MAVVTKYGTGARDPAVTYAVDGIFAAAETRVLNSKISVANGDSINSIYWIGDVPADAILDPASTYYYSAITSVSDIDVGFYYPNGGALIDIDNLVDGDDVSSAGSQTLFGHGTLIQANLSKRVWELAGLTANPGGNLSIVATLKAAATAAGTIDFKLRYWKGA